MKRRAPAIAIATVLFTTAFLFAPIVKGALSGSPRFFEWDVPEQYWPDLVYLCGSLHEGELPSWNPYDRGGYPYYADPQSAQYHPTSWAICALAGPSPSLAWASWRVLFGFALAGLFGLLWLRRIGASHAGAIAGAVVIEAAPFMRHNWELNLTGALAYLPLMLWAADRVAIERKARDGASLALATALAGWMGSPPALWLSCALTALYSIYRLGEASRVDRRAILEVALPVAIAALLSIGLLGAVLIPGSHLAAPSVQAGRSFESISEGGLDVPRMIALVWPKEGNHLYVGWVAIALGIVALRRRDRLPLFFWATAIVAALLAMGAHGPLFRFAFDYVPGVRLFRLPHRYEAWLGPAFGALAALGLTELEARWRAWERSTRARVVAGALAVIGVVMIATMPGKTPGLFVLAASVIAMAATFASGLGAAWTGALLAILIVLDVTQALPPDRHTRGGAPPAQECVDREVLAHAPGARDRWRVMDEFAMSCRAGTRLRVRDLRGYQDPLMLASYEGVIDSLTQHPALAPQFGVRYALVSPHFIHGWDHHYLPRERELRERVRTRVAWERGERSVIELEDALPFAYFVPDREVERVPDREAALERVKELAPGAIAILEVGEPTGERASSHPPLAVARDVHLSPDSLSFVIDAPARGVVIVNEVHYPGWRATVDGRSTAISRANALVRAVRVGAGRHEVRMTFTPSDGAPWRLALVVSLVVAVVLALAGAFDVLRRSSGARGERLLS